MSKSRSRVSWEKFSKLLRSYLGLRYHLVGVNLRKDDITQSETRFRPEKPMAHCQMVRLAALEGRIFAYGESDEICPLARNVLGFRASEHEPGMHAIKSILISPLDQLRRDPDVILAILNPKQMMDLAGSLGSKDLSISMKFTSEAACREFTSKPFLDRTPSLSMLCSGARMIYSDYRDDEMIFGAPPEFYAQFMESIQQSARAGGALCGCRVSNLPECLWEGFQRAGLSKGIDYFFGRIHNRELRVYLNKDSRGRFGLITMHLPIKSPSQEQAQRILERLEPLISRPYGVARRDCWIDLTLTANADELGVDLLDGESIKFSLERFVKQAERYLERAGVL